MEQERPLLERGCPLCGGRLSFTKITPSWAWVAFIASLIGGFAISWVFIPIAVVVAVVSTQKVLKCQGKFADQTGQGYQRSCGWTSERM